MTAATTPAGAAPDPAPDWHSINWKKVWHTVRRLQARIVKAVQEGRWNKVASVPSPLARVRGQRLGRQPGAVTSELSSSGPQQKVGGEQSGVPRGAFVKARAVCEETRLYGS
jgi:hypothetical protein